MATIATVIPSHPEPGDALRHKWLGLEMRFSHWREQERLLDGIKAIRYHGVITKCEAHPDYIDRWISGWAEDWEVER